LESKGSSLSMLTKSAEIIHPKSQRILRPQDLKEINVPREYRRRLRDEGVSVDAGISNTSRLDLSKENSRRRKIPGDGHVGNGKQSDEGLLRLLVALCNF
jgi:hypothetical protein